MADVSDVSFTINSSPPLRLLRGRDVTITTDGGFTVDAAGMRVITGAALSADGHWQAWRRVLPTRRNARDAGSALAELLAPMLAFRQLAGKQSITVVTDCAAVKTWLRQLVGPAGINPRHLTGPAFRFPTVPAPRHLYVVQRPRTDPRICIAHDLAAVMRNANRVHRPFLAGQLDGIVRTGLGLHSITCNVLGTERES